MPECTCIFQGKDETEQFDEISGNLKNTQLYAGKISALMNPITYVMVNIAILCILWFGGWQVQIGSVSQGQIVALVNYMNQILLALVALANLIVAVTRALACAIRINEVFRVNSSMKEGAEEKNTQESGKPRVVFDHVTFTYGGAQEPSLTDISFSAMPGETVGIIGGTGSGKSTLVNLIPRFYDATKGSVTVDGQDVKAYTFRHLREKIGVVPQKAVLFLGTIRSNLLWRKKDTKESELWKALQIAQAEEVVKKKQKGLDEKVETGGRNFSGGQRQRLTIARALVGGPDILILDDSASALDFATDAALRRSIKENTKKATVFLVSQRAATVKNADQILVLDDGSLWEKERMRNCSKPVTYIRRSVCHSFPVRR